MTTVVNLLDQNRLVVLTGVGGIGKTTLSIEVGHQVLDTFPDGTWFVELAPIADPVLVAQTTATAIGLRENSNQSILETLLNDLREKRSLLILDNCEHLIHSTTEFSESILKNCPQAKILASSRENVRHTSRSALHGSSTFPSSNI